MRFGISRGLGLAAAAIAMTAAMPAFAQDDASLDTLLDESATPADALALARKQAAEGDLLGAAATLERALMTHSKHNPEVRLYYATTLCNLGDKQTALNEISRTGRVDPDSAAWAEARAACGDVPLPEGGDQLTISAEASIGIAYDSDLSRSLLVEYALPGYPMVASDDGFSYTQSLRANVRAPLGGNTFAYANGNGATRNALTGSGPHYLVADLALGLGTTRGGTEISIGSVLRHAAFDGDPFVTEYGGEAAISYGTPSGKITLRGELVHQNYMGSTVSFSRDGLRYDVGIGYSGRSGATRFWLGGAYEHKEADTFRTGYAGARIGASVRQGLTPGGAYATLGTQLRYVEYNDELGYTPVAEMRFFSRAALGIPIGIDGVGVEAAGTYSSRSYNETSTLRNYDNVGAELRLVWTFGN